MDCADRGWRCFRCLSVVVVESSKKEEGVFVVVALLVVVHLLSLFPPKTCELKPCDARRTGFG